jgi:HTH-type transcriptional regulator, transcriptional repressor of NAD biosynthesis genes
MKKYKNSLVLGKFYGLHMGHIYLIDKAIENSENVNVLVCYNNKQNIPGEIRFNTLKSIFKDYENVNIQLVDDGDLPQYDWECDSLDEFYSYWVPFVYKYVTNLDVVFTSEDYGDDFAKYLGIKHYLVDKERIKYPVSGTKIRTNPLQNWQFIPNEMKPYFVKRIVLMGPESVGKSTLTINLANHFDTNYVEEWGRTVYENNGNKIYIDDFIPISKERQKIEDDRIKFSNKLIFCDTEDITTYLFSKMYYPQEYKKVEEYFLNSIDKKEKYDLYLLLKPDCDGVQDGTRNFLNERLIHYQQIKEELIKRNIRFFEIEGDWDQRLLNSIKIIKSEFNI